MILSLNRADSTNIRSARWKSRRNYNSHVACSTCQRPVEKGETFFYRLQKPNIYIQVAGLCCQFETYEG